MTLNKHASHKIESECKCYYDEIYIQNRFDNATVRIRITNHADDKEDVKGFHNKTVIEIPFTKFLELIKEVNIT